MTAVAIVLICLAVLVLWPRQAFRIEGRHRPRTTWRGPNSPLAWPCPNCYAKPGIHCQEGGYAVKAGYCHEGRQLQPTMRN